MLFGKEADREIKPLVEDTLRILKESLSAVGIRIGKYLTEEIALRAAEEFKKKENLKEVWITTN